MLDALVAYFHYLGMIGLVAALVTEHALLGGPLDQRRWRQLGIADRVYWLSVAAVVASGLLRTYWFGKGAPFYAGNPLFHVKLGLFTLVVGLSVYPALILARMRRSVREGMTPGTPDANIARMTLFVRLGLAVVILVPLLAVSMGRGFGY